MSTFPFQTTRDERRYSREIDNHHNNQLMAKSSQQLEKYTKQQVLAQLKHADAVVKLHDEQREANSLSRESLEVISRGLNEVIYAVENLAENEARTTEAVNTLSDIVALGLQRLSQQSAQQHREALEIARNPLRTEAQELAKEAEKWLKLGAELEGPDQGRIFKEAMQALLDVTKNPVGNRDYITCFHIGFLLWKSEDNLAEAEKSFDRARFLSIGAKDVWHISSIRHLAEMRHLRGGHQEAYATIREALLLGRDYNLLFDAARYAARAGRQDEYAKLLEECIELQPITIATMLGERDFTATQANKAALFQLRDRLLQKKRAEIRKTLTQLSELRAVSRDVAHKAELTIQLPPILVYELAEIEEAEKEIDTTDYLKLIALQARTRKAIQSSGNTIRETLESKLKDIRTAENQAQAGLKDFRPQIEQLLLQAKAEKERAIAAVENAAKNATLPETPNYIKQVKWGLLVGVIYPSFCLVVGAILFNIHWDQPRARLFTGASA